MKQKGTILLISMLVAMLILACGGGTSVATSAPQQEEPAATEAAVTEAATSDTAATEAPAATEAAAEWIVYSDAEGFISVEIPGAWTHETKEDGNVFADNFYPEEGGAYVQNMIYDDGTTWNQSMAGQVALIVLNQAYTDGAGDIKISKDEPQSDGSERLTWTSKAGNYSGVTVFKASGKKLILFSVLYNNDAKDYYEDQVNHVLETLTFN
jgi:hypothetical protein